MTLSTQSTYSKQLQQTAPPSRLLIAHTRNDHDPNDKPSHVILFVL